MALFYGFSQSFSLSFRLLYFARLKHVSNFAFFEVSNLLQIADFRDDCPDAGDGYRLPQR